MAVCPDHPNASVTARCHGKNGHSYPFGSREIPKPRKNARKYIPGAWAPRQRRGERRLRFMFGDARKTIRQAPAPPNGGSGTPAVARFQQIVQHPLTAWNGCVKLNKVCICVRYLAKTFWLKGLFLLVSYKLDARKGRCTIC